MVSRTILKDLVCPERTMKKKN